MSQNELIEQITNSLDYNFTNESKFILVSEILENLTNNIEHNEKTKKDVKIFNTLSTMLLQINEIIES